MPKAAETADSSSLTQALGGLAVPMVPGHILTWICVGSSFYEWLLNPEEQLILDPTVMST